MKVTRKGKVVLLVYKVLSRERMLSVFRRVKNSLLSLLFILISEAILLWHGTQWLWGGGDHRSRKLLHQRWWIIELHVGACLDCLPSPPSLACESASQSRWWPLPLPPGSDPCLTLDENKADNQQQHTGRKISAAKANAAPPRLKMRTPFPSTGMQINFWIKRIWV